MKLTVHSIDGKKIGEVEAQVSGRFGYALDIDTQRQVDIVNAEIKRLREGVTVVFEPAVMNRVSIDQLVSLFCQRERQHQQRRWLARFCRGWGVN